MMTPSQVMEHAARIAAGTVAMNNAIATLRQELLVYKKFVADLGGFPGVSDLDAMSQKLGADSRSNFRLLQERIVLRSVCLEARKCLEGMVRGEADLAELQNLIEAISGAIEEPKNQFPHFKMVPIEASSEMCDAAAKVLSKSEAEYYEMMGRFLVAYSAALKVV